MLAATHSKLLLRDHCISRHFKFKTYNCSFIYQRYQPLYLPNIIFLTLCFELYLNLRGKTQVSQKWRTNYLLPYRGCLNVHEKNMEKNFLTKKSIFIIKKFITQSRTGLQIYEGHGDQLNRPGPMA
jgi:hypothetical protein